MSKQAARERLGHRLQASDPLGDAAAALGMTPSLAACVAVAQTAAEEDNSVPGTLHPLLHAGFAATVLDRLVVMREKVREASARPFEPATITSIEGQQWRMIGTVRPQCWVPGGWRLSVVDRPPRRGTRPATRRTPAPTVVRTGHASFPTSDRACATSTR